MVARGLPVSVWGASLIEIDGNIYDVPSSGIYQCFEISPCAFNIPSGTKFGRVSDRDFRTRVARPEMQPGLDGPSLSMTDKQVTAAAEAGRNEITD